MTYKMRCCFLVVFFGFLVMPATAAELKKIAKIGDRFGTFEYYIKSSSRGKNYSIINNAGERLQILFFTIIKTLEIGESVSFSQRELEAILDKTNTIKLYSLRNNPKHPKELGELELSYFQTMGNYTIVRKTIKPSKSEL